MPLKVGHGGHVDEDILASFGKESFSPHLYLIGLGWMFHNFDDHHLKERTHETEHPLNAVDDETCQDEGPCLQEGKEDRRGEDRREGRRGARIGTRGGGERIGAKGGGEKRRSEKGDEEGKCAIPYQGCI